MKDRIDVLLVKKGFFQSREKAKSSIMAGVVFVDGQRVDKVGTVIDEEKTIEIKENICPYVSRGGLKIEKAAKLWNLSLHNNIAMDIGASTGGFTDFMIRNGATKVYAVDVGYGQLDYKLRNDPRIVNMERTNIRYIDEKDIDRLDFISIDVSFISLGLVLPVANKLLKDSGQIVCLVKPQFEAGKNQVGKKGIVRDVKVHKQVIEEVIKKGLELGLYPHGLTFSPVTGAKGNIEYLLLLKKYENSFNYDIIEDVTKNSHRELGSK